MEWRMTEENGLGAAQINEASDKGVNAPQATISP
jgi:hypothetical protein